MKPEAVTRSDSDGMLMHRSSKMIEMLKPGSDAIWLGAVYDDNDADGLPDTYNQFQHQGTWVSSTTGLHTVRYRIGHPTFGRWMQRDPAGHADGMNLLAAYHTLLEDSDPDGTAVITKTWKLNILMGHGPRFAHVTAEADVQDCTVEGKNIRITGFIFWVVGSFDVDDSFWTHGQQECTAGDGSRGKRAYATANIRVAKSLVGWKRISIARWIHLKWDYTFWASKCCVSGEPIGSSFGGANCQGQTRPWR